MITERIFIMRHRCNTRWIWREWSDFNRPLTEIKAPHIPESAIGEIVHKACQIYWARKKPKKGTDIFKAAWYKSMGYKLV